MMIPILTRFMRWGRMALVMQPESVSLSNGVVSGGNLAM